MSQINPLLGSILQTPQAQKQQSDTKDQQVRRSRELLKNSAPTQNPEDVLDIEVPVESAEELKPIQDQGPDARQRPPQRHRHHPAAPQEDADDERLDLTA
jgi:hypothetical protein